MKNKKVRSVKKKKPATRKRKTKKKSNGRIYKTLTIIFGIATFIFGGTSIYLTVYSINLQKREAESRRILEHLDNILGSLHDTTTNVNIQNVTKLIQSQIPRNYKFYVHSISSLADTVEYYGKKLKEEEKRLIKSLPPNQLLTTSYPPKGYILEKPLFFEFLEPRDVIRVAKNQPAYIPVKLKIAPEEVFCFHIEIKGKRYLLTTYNYKPQGVYNKLEIIEIPPNDTITAAIGIFLKRDTLSTHPRFYRRETKVIWTGTK